MTVSAALSLRDRRRIKAQDEIVELALELFQKRGYEATSVEDIASRSLISVRTFYRYFAAKEDVVFHDFPDAAPRIRSALAELARAPLYEQLEAGALEQAEVLQGSKDRVLPRLELILEIPELYARHLRDRWAHEQLFARAIAKRLKPSAARARIAEMAAAAGTGAFGAALRRWVNGRGRPALHRLTTEALSVLRPSMTSLERT